MIDHYQTLGLPFGSTIEQVKKAYREYVMHFHPDKHNNNLFFTERFKEIQTAYEILRNPQTRTVFENLFSSSNTSSDVARLNRELQISRLTLSQQATAIVEAKNRIQFLENEISALKNEKSPKIKQQTYSQNEPPSRWTRAWKVYRKHNAEKEPDKTLKQMTLEILFVMMGALIIFWLKELIN